MGRYGRSSHGKPRRKPSDPRPCDRDTDCTTRVVVAVLAPTPSGSERRWAAFEAEDRTPWSDGAVGCRVIVAGRQAWRPADLVEDYVVRHGLTETAARDLVGGFPWHRLHHHESPSTTDSVTDSTAEKETTHP